MQRRTRNDPVGSSSSDWSCYDDADCGMDEDSVAATSDLDPDGGLYGDMDGDIDSEGLMEGSDDLPMIDPRLLIQ